MSIIQAIILGIIQGATEFIPVSSSGHLVAAPFIFNWSIPEDQLFAFDVLVQMGTLVAVLAFFWKDLINIFVGAIKGLKQPDRWKIYEVRMALYLIIATIPAALAGLLLKDVIESAFGSLTFTAISLLVTAVLLIIAEWAGRKQKDMEDMNWLDALIMGIFQILALFPGISRSGATITGGMLSKMERKSAAKFSFLMSIPIMLGAGLVTVFDLGSIEGLSSFIPVMTIGFITSALVGFLAIKWLMKYLADHPLYHFSYYLIILGIILLIFGS
jgi:undecaprenyl-diphosphatase